MAAARSAAIRALLDGAPGLEVKERVRRLGDGWRTLTSLNAEMSTIRCAVYAQFEPMIPQEKFEVPFEQLRLARLVVARS